MSGRAVKWILVLLLAAHLAGPLFETVDHWDHFPQKPDDIVLSITGALTLLGAAFGLIFALRGAMRARRLFRLSLFRPGALITSLAGDLLIKLPISVHSPPLLLRI